MQEINQNKNENLQKIEGKDGRNKKRYNKRADQKAGKQ